jgi:ParB family chromosome partitioning protein
MNAEFIITEPHVRHNTGKNNEWYTPKYIIDAARKTMGSIDLDPASSEIANKTVQASTYYTKEDDGLSKPWFGNIWLNPPYSKELILKFVLAVKNKRAEYDQAIILVNNATETRWFQELLSVASAICFVDRRIKFLDINGKPGSPLQGQAILYVGSQHSKFVVNFSQYGECRIKCDLIFDLNTASENYIENFREQFLFNIKNQGYYAIGHRNWKIR